MLAPSRLFTRSAGSLLARSSIPGPSTRASSSSLPTESTPSEPTQEPILPPSSSLDSSLPSSSSASAPYFTVPSPRPAVVRSSWSAPSVFGYPSSPAETILTDPTNQNLAHYVLPSTPHSPLALLSSQTSRYILCNIHTQKMLLHPKDILTLPRLSSNPAIGSTISLSRIIEVGSRDFSLKAPVNQRLMDVRCSLTVLEHTSSPMEIMNKKKRRKGYQKQIRSRSQYTRLRVGEIELVGNGDSVAPDEQPKERTLDRPVDMGVDDFKTSDNSMRGRMAKKFGIIYPKSIPAPPRPKGV